MERISRNILNWSFILLLTGLAFACGGNDGSDDPQPDEPGGFMLKADKDTVDNTGHDRIRFTVWLGDKDVTAQSSIVNQSTHEELKDNFFSPAETCEKGFYTFKATYKKHESAGIKITVIDGESFLKHLFLMYFTSVYCPNCPRYTAALEQEVLPLSPGRVDLLGLHGDLSGAPDPYTHRHTNTLLTHFNLPGYPFVVIDHRLKWGAEIEQLTAALNEIGLAGIALNTSVDENRQLTAEVRVKARRDFEQPCSVAVVLLEDGLKTNNETFNWVLRDYLTDVYGDKESSGTGNIGWNKEWSRTFRFSLPEAYAIENMRLMVYVLSPEGRALNSRQVKLGEKADYEMVHE